VDSVASTGRRRLPRDRIYLNLLDHQHQRLLSLQQQQQQALFRTTR
jgi:hypothetical protein